MLTTPLTIILFLLPHVVHLTPSPPEPFSQDIYTPALARRKDGILPGSCEGSLHYPTEDAYIKAYKDYCTTKIHVLYTMIREDEPIVFTYNVSAADGKNMEWVFITAVAEGRKPAPGKAFLETNTDECLYRMGSVIEDSRVLGGMGKAWCVVDGTGGDAFADQSDVRGMYGQGMVMVKGGVMRSGWKSGGWGGEVLGEWVWESRPKVGGL